MSVCYNTAMKKTFLAACGALALHVSAVSADTNVFTTAEGPDWVRCDYRRDIVPASAFDFSSRLDAPAGKYGWTKAVNGHLEFEGRPGVPVRFYGCNVGQKATVPATHAAADALVNRLVALGYNAIRIHQQDSFVTGFRPGCRLDEGIMERLDYLVARAIAKGLYVTTDLFASRHVSWKELGIDRSGRVDMHAYKSLTLVHDGAFENWKTFAKNFLTHVNPYTGRRYLDEPAVFEICTVNEGWFMTGWFLIRDLPEVKARYEAWRAAKVAKFGPDFMKHSCATNVMQANCYGWKNAATCLFLAETHAEGHAHQVAFLRELGVKALLVAGNHGPNNAPNGRLRAQLFDVVDNHCYEDHPIHLNKQNRWHLPSACENRNPILSLDAVGMNGVCFSRVAEKPFTVTEWQFSGPAECRGIAGIYGGALMARQDWDGVWRFAYDGGTEVANDRPGPMGMPGYFALAYDPLMQATERMVVNLFLRRDIAPLVPRVNLVVDEKSLMPEGPKKGDWETVSVQPKKTSCVWDARCSSSLAAVPDAANFALSDWGSRFGAREDPLPVAPAADGLVTIDRTNGVFRLATSRTCGIFAAAGRYAAGALAAEVASEKPLTVAVTSLEDEPIVSSRRLLVSHLTDCRGNGTVMRTDEHGRLVTESAGRDFCVIRDATTRVAVRLANPSAYRVWALETSGARRFVVPSEVRDGALVFAAAVRGEDGRAVLEYEVAMPAAGAN